MPVAMAMPSVIVVVVSLFLSVLFTAASPHSNSNSVLVALLDSRYTELAELVDKALLLPTLEQALDSHNLTIFAPVNDALDPNLKHFLLQPRNLASLQTLVLSHFVPNRISSSDWPTSPRPTLATHHLLSLDNSHLVHPDDVVRPDGIIHGIDRLLVPRSVQDHFNQRRSLSAVKPEPSPEVDRRLKTPHPASPPARPIYAAMAPGPSLAPAPAPGPGAPAHHFDGEAQVKDFIHTLLHYGGYSEMADILVNLTSLATDMGRLVSQGYVLTVLAPNDEAMAKLATDRLSEPGAPERIVYYHIIPEYQTEESMYNAVRRFGRVRYDTLRVPHKVMAEEADGSVRFGQGDGSAYLFDPDIYTDGRISVQGIDGVLFPAEETEQKPTRAARLVSKQRRGKLLEVTCNVLGVAGLASHFTTCH